MTAANDTCQRRFVFHIRKNQQRADGGVLCREQSARIKMELKWTWAGYCWWQVPEGSRAVGGCEQEALRLGRCADQSGRRKRPALVRGSASRPSRRESHLYVEYLTKNVLQS